MVRAPPIVVPLSTGYKFFSECSSIVHLPDISIWAIDNVINMNAMFYKCSSLISLPNISSWNTSLVTDMSLMFTNSITLTSLPNISKWNLSSVENMNDFCENCISLLNKPNYGARIFVKEFPLIGEDRKYYIEFGDLLDNYLNFINE